MDHILCDTFHMKILASWQPCTERPTYDQSIQSNYQVTRCLIMDQLHQLLLMNKYTDSENNFFSCCRSRNNQRGISNDRFRPYNTRNRSSLAIRQLMFEDAGNYSAESEDSYGTSLLASIELNVEKRKAEVPIFLKRLHDLSVKIGSRNRFLVEIESLPPLKVSTADVSLLESKP